MSSPHPDTKARQSWGALFERARMGMSDSVFRGFLLALCLHVMGQGASFGLQIVYARVLGTSQYGALSIAFAWISIGLIGCKIGFDLTLLRLLPRYQSSQQWGHFRGLLAVGRYLPVAVTCVVAVVASVVLLQSPGTRNSPVRATLLLAAWFLPLAVYSELTAAALRAMQRVALAIVGESISRPVMAIVLVIILYVFLDGTMTSAAALLPYVVATVFSAALLSFWLSRNVPVVHKAARPVREIRYWLAVSVPLTIASAFQVLLYSIDVIMLGALTSSADSGVYNAAGKLSMMALFAMNAIQLAAGPLISTSIARNDSADLRSVVRTATLTSLAIAVPIVAVLIVFRSDVLGMFGAGFAAGGTALIILALAQLFNTATGPVGLILSLSGQQNRLVACLALGLVVNVVLNVLLIPRYGIVGAACSAAIAHVSWNSAAVLAVVKHVAVNPTAFPLWRAIGRGGSPRGSGS